MRNIKTERKLQPGFVGREEELGELKARLENALEGRGSTVFIAGEAGIGKTRLVEELILYAETKNFKLLHGWCQREALAPYMPFNEALKSAGLEYLIADTPPPKVECVYLVNNAGLLLAKSERKESMLDPEIFTAMLTAVGDFVKDSFRSIEGETSAAGGLSGLEYKDWKILIHTSASAALVVIMKGRENEFLKDDMAEIMLNFEKNYGEVLKIWRGKIDKVQNAEQLIKPLITSGKYDGIDYARELQDPKLKMGRLYDNVLSGIIRESKKQPLLIFIDDLQWADPSTLGIIHYLARNTRTAAVLIIGTYRPEDTVAAWDGKTHQLVDTMQLMMREDLLHKIELQRFTKEGMIELLNAHFGNVQLSTEFFDRLYKETEGNPLFTLEVFKMLIDEKVIEFDTTTYHVRADVGIDKIKIPDKIYDVITRRLNRLEKEYRELLDPAAVEGEYFHAETIEKIIGINRLKVLRALNTIEQMHKLIRSLKDKFKFDHVKIREVIYSELNPLLRREYHKLVAQCIEEQNKDNLSAVVPELATHYYLAEEIDKAIPYLMQAGKKAKDNFANKEAMRFYQEALEFLGKKCVIASAEQKLECIENLSDIHVLAGNYDIGVGCLNDALAVISVAPDVSVQSKLLQISNLNRKTGEIYEKISRYDKALQYYDKAIAAARAAVVEGSPEPIEIASVYNAIGWIYCKKSEYDKAIEYNQKALRIAELHRDEKEIATSFHMIGTSYWEKGDYNLALEFLNKSSEIRERINDSIRLSASYNNIGLVYQDKGELDRALEYYMKSLMIDERIGNIYGIVACYDNIGNVYAYKGELVRALEYHTKNLEIKKKIGDTYGVALSYNCIGSIHAERDEWDEAIVFYTKSLDICQKTVNKLLSVFNYVGLCNVHAHIGKIADALNFGQKALELSEEIGAKERIAESNKVLGVAYTIKQDWILAEKHFEESIKIYKEIGHEIELGKAYYEYAAMLKSRGDVPNAEKYFQKALEVFEGKKITRWSKKVKEALAQIGTSLQRLQDICGHHT